MFCPQCRKEFASHVMVCPACNAGTVDRLPEPEPGTRDVELVAVLTTSDPALIAVAQSLLDAEEIDYFVRGDGLQDLIGAGRIAGFNVAVGGADFFVRADDADRARELLQPLTAPASTSDESAD